MLFSRVAASALLVCGGVFLSGAPANAAPSTVTVCASGCDHSTIQDAVTAVDAGSTINVQTGTYNETTPILIAKPLTIKGAGAGSTIVDGGGAAKSIFEIRPALAKAGAGAIELSDMTIQNAGATTANVRLLVKQVTTGISAINLQRLDINAAGTSYGIYADGGITGSVDRVAPEFTLTDSKVKGHANNGIGIDAWRGKSTIADNDLYEGTTGRGAILVMNEYTTSRMPDPVIVKDNTSVGRLVYVKNYVGPTFGGYDDIQVTGNVINGLAGGTGTDCNTAVGPDCGILVSSNAPSSGGVTQMDKVLVTGNSMRGDGVSTGTAGVFIGGDVKDTKINENNIVGLGAGIDVDVAQVLLQNAVAVEAHRNGSSPTRPASGTQRRSRSTPPKTGGAARTDRSRPRPTAVRRTTPDPAASAPPPGSSPPQQRDRPPSRPRGPPMSPAHSAGSTTEPRSACRPSSSALSPHSAPPRERSTRNRAFSIRPTPTRRHTRHPQTQHPQAK